MPKLWNDTIETHRRAVREAVLSAAAALVAEHGLKAVTMSQIAETSGIGRATLYKYFPDVESILQTWHQEKIAEHLEELTRVRDTTNGPLARLEAVLTAYAFSSGGQHGTELAALLHRGAHVAQAHRQLEQFVGELIASAVTAGEVRDDVAPAELASYCVHAMTAARGTSSHAAVHRLVAVVLAGLKPQR
jgi:AcrR family transcriptional regulator